jgi:hypothetical protein
MHLLFRTLLEFILKDAVEELRGNRSFARLHAIVTQFQTEYKEERKLFTELIELGLTAPGLKKDLASEKQKTQYELQDSLQTLAKVQVKNTKINKNRETYFFSIAPSCFLPTLIYCEMI